MDLKVCDVINCRAFIKRKEVHMLELFGKKMTVCPNCYQQFYNWVAETFDPDGKEYAPEPTDKKLVTSEHLKEPSPSVPVAPSVVYVPYNQPPTLDPGSSTPAPYTITVTNDTVPTPAINVDSPPDGISYYQLVPYTGNLTPYTGLVVSGVNTIDAYKAYSMQFCNLGELAS